MTQRECRKRHFFSNSLVFSISEVYLCKTNDVRFRIMKHLQIFLKKLTGKCVVPKGTNFAGYIYINNISYRNAHPINLNVFGGWSYSALG